ncbi:amidase [Pseudomonas sp. CC120222-01a]|uniref:amidase n=1 Tax=Pseudomonas sp. CC120222-01a TaxID=1378075 RepID=UPI000D8FE51C|nr:amidase [Pseudomonas sp. CC120222-01a]PVZ36866.1 amidase/aspartyl-tRNA(Asn)/glutamyl-tRNA(Gln) amidotransferase subunit A [Pseudomonas sp. CC120222-01a]
MLNHPSLAIMRCSARPEKITIKQCSAIAAALFLSVVPHVGAAQFNVVELTIDDVQAGFAEKKFTSEELTKAYLDRIKIYEPYYNAFTSMNSKALETARAIDKRRASGEALGPLAGVPVVVKEAIDIAGMPSTVGWAPLSSATGGVDLIPEHDAPVVTRLHQAGAIILGKTNIPAFSNDATRANTSWDGPTYNVVNKEIAPGASSSGTATAISGNFAVVGLAEETGGSIQNPASAQSLVSVKPTFALVPNTGVAPLAGSTRDVVGPHARTVRDAAILLDVLAGYSAADAKTVAAIGMVPAKGYTSKLSTTALKGVRVGLYGPGWRTKPLSNETRALYQRAIQELRAQGAVVVEDPFAGSNISSLAMPNVEYDPRGTESLAYDFEQYLQRLGPSAAAHSIESLKAILKVDPFSSEGPLGWYPTVLPELAKSLKEPALPPDLSEFYQLREAYLAAYNGAFKKHNLDLLVYPQSSAEIPTVYEQSRYPETAVSEINIIGSPGVTVPAGQYKNGSPFGLLFMGPMWSEADLLGYAYAYEQSTHHRVVPVLTKVKSKRPDIARQAN